MSPLCTVVTTTPVHMMRGGGGGGGGAWRTSSQSFQRGEGQQTAGRARKARSALDPVICPTAAAAASQAVSGPRRSSATTSAGLVSRWNQPPPT